MRNTDSQLRQNEPILRIADLNVFYGPAHVLQGVSLDLKEGVLAVVGRNGMGKTTLCKAITGMTPAKGSIQYRGAELVDRPSDEITRLGVAYVPQGRRIWRSLTVDETLRLSSKTARQGAWTVDRVYSVFPRLAERKSNGGAQLSGGEQQMLAIGRALLFNPGLLVMDEPTEGLAPVIVEQVATLLKQLADEHSMAVLLIEQNLGVALEVADDIAIMVNGRIAHRLPAAQLAADRGLQQRLLGLKAGAAEESRQPQAEPAVGQAVSPVMRLVRAHGGREDAAVSEAATRDWQDPVSATQAIEAESAVYLTGAWAKRQREMVFIKRCLEAQGVRVISVDIAGSGFSAAQVGAHELTRHHPDFRRHLIPTGGAGNEEILGPSLAAFLRSRADIGALLAIADTDTMAVALAGAAALPTEMPKLVVTDQPQPTSQNAVLQMHMPADELKRINETLLAHTATVIAGMLRAAPQTTKTLKQS